MSKFFSGVFVAALLLLILPSRSSAQTLETGTWTGYIVPPTGERMDITYDVAVQNDTLKISLVAPMGSVPTSNIVVMDDGLTFEWMAGNTYLFCELAEKENGVYEGECAPADGASGVMVMNPPMKEE